LIDRVWVRTLGRVPRGVWAAAVAFTMLAVTVLALMPPNDKPGWFPHSDKFEHALAFAVLTVMGRLAWPRSVSPVAVAMLVYGVVIEVLQGTFTARTASVADVLADTTGIAIGLWVTRRVL
jgi:VanZ family protein